MKTKARQRRRIHAILALIWLVPGGAVTYLLLHSVAWIVGMSWYGIVALHVVAWSAETPVEQEQ